LCEGCISLSNTEGLLPAEKTFDIQVNKNSLVSALKGKNKGKYIRLEYLIGDKP